jgi:hypothetical protein
MNRRLHRGVAHPNRGGALSARARDVNGWPFQRS